MSLRLYNTLTKQKELFEPVVPGKVGIYVCGPTVYKDSHIGHAVGPVIFDALKKYLVYKGYDVRLVINITDVDDKLIIEAERLGISIEELAKQVSAGYFESMEKLSVNSIDEYPRATDHIQHIITLIQKLGEGDAAYESDGDVYFDVTKCHDYGKLSHRKSEDQMEGTRELAGGGKRNTADFALWKKAGDDEIGWDSPWGRGRPGWHIECSAMSMEYLGETFDIHGGGMDLIFPHHENEIAQAETATCKPFARYWMHNGLTRVKTKQSSGEWSTEKMSKSLGNIRSLKGILEEYSPECIRFFLLSTHYRRPIDFSDESILAVQKGMMNIYRLLERVERATGEDVFAGKCKTNELESCVQDELDTELKDAILNTQLRYLEALDDDFNTAGAMSTLFELCNVMNRYIDKKRIELQGTEKSKTMVLDGARMITTLGQVIGLLEKPLAAEKGGDGLTDKLMELLIELRAEAKKSKNFELADAIRDKLKAMGVVLEDSPEGTRWRKE